jgi:hypothetical protein
LLAGEHRAAIVDQENTSSGSADVHVSSSLGLVIAAAIGLLILGRHDSPSSEIRAKGRFRKSS